MDRQNIKMRILDVFSKIGFLIDDEAIDLNEYIPDSIGFVTLIIEIEDEFGVNFPNELLNINSFNSIENLVTIIDDLLYSAEIKL